MLKRSLLLISLSFLSTSCMLIPDAHRIEITQGNIIEQESIDQLSLGMTEEQVKFVMGSPAIQDIFHPNRWDYIHYVDRQREKLINQQLTLVFKDGLLQQARSKDFDVAKLQAVSTIQAAPIVEAVVPAAEPEVLASTPSAEDRIKTSVQNWAAAWSQQDIEAYVGSYIANYSPDSSHNAWVKQRKAKLSRPKSIAIGIEDLAVMILDENTARAEFKQDYRSNTYHDQVLKQMTLSKQDDGWKISAEKTLKKLK